MAINGSAVVAENLAHAAKEEDLSHATAHVANQHEAHPSALGLDGTGWVALAMLAVIALLLWKKVPAVIGGALDKKIATIRSQLDEAKTLRAEAEALKADYQAKSAAAANEAAGMLAQAKIDADRIVEQAKVDAAALIERRGRMAEDKIAAAERGAVAEVRARAATAAASAAAALIAERHDASADGALVDQTIAGLGSARLN